MYVVYVYLIKYPETSRVPGYLSKSCLCECCLTVHLHFLQNKIEFKRVNYSNVFNGDTEGTAIALGAVSADSQLNRGGCVYTHTWHVDKFTRKKYMECQNRLCAKTCLTVTIDSKTP